MRAAIKGFLTEEAEREQVEERLIHDPAAGQVIAGTGGFRKLRVAPGGGKSGGGRLVYYMELEAEP